MPSQWILVADDDPLIRELWVEALGRAGYRTLPAKTGHEAIDLMRAIVPDLAILDLRMPVLRHVPVLIVSGFLEDEPSQVATGLTIVGRLAKPLSFAALVEAVRTALERPKPLDPAAGPPELTVVGDGLWATPTDGAPETRRLRTGGRRPGEAST